MRPTNFKCPKCGYTLTELERNMQYGQVAMLITTPDQDMDGNQDCVLGNLSIALRHRRPKVDKYGEISIRAARASGARTEMAKILAGECKSQLFIFEFLDCFIVCALSDIRHALEQRIGYEKPNNDGATSAWYIPLEKIKHLRMDKTAADLNR